MFRKESNTTVILFWKPPFEAVAPFEQLDNNCVLTYDQSAVDVADAVVFHFREIPDNPKALPLEKRKEKQV